MWDLRKSNISAQYLCFPTPNGKWTPQNDYISGAFGESIFRLEWQNKGTMRECWISSNPTFSQYLKCFPTPNEKWTPGRGVRSSWKRNPFPGAHFSFGVGKHLRKCENVGSEEIQHFRILIVFPSSKWKMDSPKGAENGVNSGGPKVHLR